MMESLNKNLKHLRISKGLTQEQVAKAIGINPRTYQSWENRNIEPPLRKILVLAGFYNLTIDELIDRAPTNKIDLLTLHFATAPTNVRKAIIILLGLK